MHAQPYQHVLNPGLLEAVENWEGENFIFLLLYKISLVCYLKILCKSNRVRKSIEQYWLKVKIHRKFSTSKKRGA